MQQEVTFKWPRLSVEQLCTTPQAEGSFLSLRRLDWAPNDYPQESRAAGERLVPAEDVEVRGERSHVHLGASSSSLRSRCVIKGTLEGAKCLSIKGALIVSRSRLVLWRPGGKCQQPARSATLEKSLLPLQHQLRFHYTLKCAQKLQNERKKASNIAESFHTQKFFRSINTEVFCKSVSSIRWNIGTFLETRLLYHLMRPRRM